MTEEDVKRYADIIWAACMGSYLRGALAVAKRVPVAAALALSLVPTAKADRVINLAATASSFAPTGAVDFLKRHGLSQASIDEVSGGYRDYAFKIAGVEREELLKTVHAELVKAVEQGVSEADWAQTVNAAFDAAGVTRLKPWHLETVFQSNVMTAYNAANWDTLHEPGIEELFPMYRVIEVPDARECAICKAYGGITLPANDPWWKTHWPTYHHKCRCWILALYAAQAAKAGVVRASQIAPEPDAGFGVVRGWKEHAAVANDLPILGLRLRNVA